MWIYVVSKHDMESSWVNNAFTNEEEAKAFVENSNKEEEEKARIYNEWATSDDDDSDCPEFGDYTYTYRKMWLNGL